MLKNKGCGWLKEHKVPRLDFCSVTCGASTYPPRDSSMFEHVLSILDQGSTQSCVAQAVTQSLRTRMSAMGLASPQLPSRRWVYRMARETHGDGYQDAGTYISSACEIMRDVGWPSERHCKWIESSINLPMRQSTRRHALDQKNGVSEQAIWGTEAQKLLSIKQAVSTGIPVIFGTQVDEAFFSVNSLAPISIAGQSVGGHAMVIIGYDDISVHVLNSWGKYWGVGGICRVKWDTALDKFEDLFAILSVKRPTS